jgi:N-acetylmuramoyl-L-alanine amidase
VSVQLTRREDVYVSLGERAQIANQANADLLLSIHANAALDPNVRGIETYYLGFTDDPVVQTLAVRENATTSDGMHDLDALVQSIAMHDKVTESEVFAGLVQRHLISGVGSIYPTVQDLGVKRAPFMVLIGAEMPSVLTEVSFLTNAKEASFLATGAYREQIASALSTSIMDYQETLRTYPNSTVEND